MPGIVPDARGAVVGKTGEVLVIPISTAYASVPTLRKSPCLTPASPSLGHQPHSARLTILQAVHGLLCSQPCF